MTAPFTSWRKALASATEGACVEVARPAAVPAVVVRDSKNPAGAQLRLPATAFDALLVALRT